MSAKSITGFVRVMKKFMEIMDLAFGLIFVVVMGPTITRYVGGIFGFADAPSRPTLGATVASPLASYSSSVYSPLQEYIHNKEALLPDPTRDALLKAGTTDAANKTAAMLKAAGTTDAANKVFHTWYTVTEDHTCTPIENADSAWHVPQDYVDYRKSLGATLQVSSPLDFMVLVVESGQPDINTLFIHGEDKCKDTIEHVKW
jgi:hypothetical protein